MISKLSILTPQDKIRMAAELDGWKCYQDLFSYNTWILDLTTHHGAYDSEHLAWQSSAIPNYSLSYDAIIPLIQKLLLCKEVEDCAWNLFRETNPDIEYIGYASPSQLLDALLVAAGKAEI